MPKIIKLTYTKDTKRDVTSLAFAMKYWLDIKLEKAVVKSILGKQYSQTSGVKLRVSETRKDRYFYFYADRFEQEDNAHSLLLIISWLNSWALGTGDQKNWLYIRD